MKAPKTIRIITPAAACYLWQRSDGLLRRLALDGKLAYRTIHGLGPKPMRGYLFDACVERWGEPDQDRLGFLVTVTSYQVGKDVGAVWEILMRRPHVLDEGGDLATD